MKKSRFRTGLALAIVALLLLVATGLANTGYQVSRWVMTGGGGTTSSPGGEYRLSGAIGQSAAGALPDAPYSVQSGFWVGAAISGGYAVYLPVVVR